MTGNRLSLWGLLEGFEMSCSLLPPLVRALTEYSMKALLTCPVVEKTVIELFGKVT